MILVDKPVPIKEIWTKRETKFSGLIKIAVDIEKEKIALDGELHADCETALLETGSQQKISGAQIFIRKIAVMILSNLFRSLISVPRKIIPVWKYLILNFALISKSCQSFINWLTCILYVIIKLVLITGMQNKKISIVKYRNRINPR
jgi:hypothetical protein